MKCIAPEEEFRPPVGISFEGKEFEIAPGYDRLLRMAFGDYMVRPPESERAGEHITAYSRDEDYGVWLDRYYAEHPDEEPAWRKRQ